MAGTKEATTMSVQEMREHLGIKKTESYWLINKRYFDTVTIAGRTRVVKVSFEEWYAGQTHYRKVTGEEPGARLKTESYGIKDIADMLGITTSSVYDLLQQTGLETVTVHYRLRVPRKAFDQWYRHQDHYRNAKDRERDRPLEEKSMTVPEMGRLLGLDRREAWKLHYRIKDQLMTIRVANRPRVTRESFEQWYGNQTQYTKVSVPPTASLPPGQEALTEKAEEQRKEYYSLHEAASLLDMSERDLYRMLTYQEIQGKKIGKSWFIRYDDLRSLR